MFSFPDAIKICQKALSDAQDKIEEMNEEDFKESKALVDLLKENIRTLFNDGINFFFPEISQIKGHEKNIIDKKRVFVPQGRSPPSF